MFSIARIAPPPGPQLNGDRSLPTSLFGVEITSAVNLLEAREYRDLPHEARLSRALEEQRNFLSGLLDPSLQLAVDLRLQVTPGEGSPVRCALLGRTWGKDETNGPVSQRAEGLQAQILASLPRHVVGAPIDEAAELARWLAPFAPEARLDTASITRREIVGRPSRPDARVAYYFSVVPFNWALVDWTQVYSALAHANAPTVLSVGLMPLQLPQSWSTRLSHMATFYARLAREDRLQGGLYNSERTLPPDTFAVDAERVFRDYARRYLDRAFLMRIQLSAERQLPVGLVEAMAAAISPASGKQESHLDGDRSGSAYEIRRPATDYEAEVARWNLEAVDFSLPAGAPGIWQRPDPPAADLKLLCALGDARDASSAFRLPIAHSGTVPGFKVSRGSFGHVQAVTADGPSITLGELAGASAPLTLPVKSLTKHALVAGGTGSGKTTTVLEILRQVWDDHQVPFLVVEPVNAEADDYRRFWGQPGFESLEVFTVGDEGGHPLRFNPFEVPAGVLVSEHMANLLSCFKAAFGLWEPLPSIYDEALNLTYMTAGILPNERPDGSPRAWPSAVEFLAAMSAATADLGYEGEIKSNIEAASIRRAQQLVSGVCASTFLTNRSQDIAQLLDHPVILELKSLGAGDEQSLMIAFLLNAMTEHYQAVRGASSLLRHVTVIEEAHRLLAKPTAAGEQGAAQAKAKAAEGFANTLAENRKYGEGLIIAEQLPTKLVEDAVKNTNLKLMHRLTAEDDRRYLGETMGFDQAQSRFATRLQTGEALAYSDDLAEAMLVSIKPRLLAPVPPLDALKAAPPFLACDSCISKCSYRGAALAVIRQSANAERIRLAAGSLEQPDLTPAEIVDGWAHLTGVLREVVSAYPSLPTDEPQASAAAFCTFLHAMAAKNMNFVTEWSDALAIQLGFAPAPEPISGGAAR